MAIALCPFFGFTVIYSTYYSLNNQGRHERLVYNREVKLHVQGGPGVCEIEQIQLFSNDSHVACRTASANHKREKILGLRSPSLCMSCYRRT